MAPPAPGSFSPLCSYFLQGSCSRGTDCRFSHDCIPGSKPAGDYYARVCHYFLAGCCTNPDCKFLHSLPGLQEPLPTASHLLSSSSAYHTTGTSAHSASNSCSAHTIPTQSVSQPPLPPKQTPSSLPTDREALFNQPTDSEISSIHRQPHARTASLLVDLWEDQAGMQYGSDHVGAHASLGSSYWPEHSQHHHVPDNAQWEDEDADQDTEFPYSLTGQQSGQEDFYNPCDAVAHRASSAEPESLQALDGLTGMSACQEQLLTPASRSFFLPDAESKQCTAPLSLAVAAAPSTLSWRAPVFVLPTSARHDITQTHTHISSSVTAEEAATVAGVEASQDRDTGSADGQLDVGYEDGEEYVALGQTLLCYDFATHGTCEAGDDCCYVHGEQCKICGSNALHPFNEEASASHIAQCTALQEEKRCRELECGICLETVLTKECPSDRCFGLLACDHPFCLSCIRGWRNTDADTGINVDTALRTCPVCRKPTHYVTPSKVWPTSPGDKQLIIDRYKAALATRDCRHFSQGTRSCPFGASCHYRHAYPDGSLEDAATAAAAAAERRRHTARRSERRTLSMAGFLESLEGLRALSVLLGAPMWDDGDGAYDDEPDGYYNPGYDSEHGFENDEY